MHTVVLLLMLVTPGGGAPEVDVTGWWRICYEPGLPGVVEPDHAYLFLGRDGEYRLVSREVLRTGWRERCGPYLATRGGIVLFLQRDPAYVRRGLDEFYRWDLALLREREVEWWPEEDCDHSPVLTPGADANYGFARWPGALPAEIQPTSGCS